MSSRECLRRFSEVAVKKLKLQPGSWMLLASGNATAPLKPKLQGFNGTEMEKDLGFGGCFQSILSTATSQSVPLPGPLEVSVSFRAARHKSKGAAASLSSQRPPKTRWGSSLGGAGSQTPGGSEREACAALAEAWL